MRIRKVFEVTHQAILLPVSSFQNLHIPVTYTEEEYGHMYYGYFYTVHDENCHEMSRIVSMEFLECPHG